jgi:hypothetical protein
MLNANTVNGYTYQWLLNGNSVIGATAPDYFATTSGNYSYAATTVMGCSAISGNATVTVNTLPPIPVITQNGNILSTDPGYFYQWFLNGNPIGGATSQTYSVSLTGNYSVEINDGNNCSSLSTDYFMNPMNVASISPNENPDATIYPNPFNGTATINLQLPVDVNVSIEINNLLGEKIYETGEGKLSAGMNSVLLDKSMFAGSGTYFVKIFCGNSVLTRKVVVL